ncbi:MAG: EscU/YscU/HrcU family type III secretion system export apparatus switch protein [Nitrospira sp.]|nr:EscU/YscU/HrcU family type III secretion system export apparatus switch protein [bacterium]MBL7049475.1 EscU/YscU/HrcU family type III secretion system export apparatus switch protein [Nitrospira sp.]
MKKPQDKAAALRYTEGKDTAPKLIAKGRGKVAEKILAIAKAHDIPVKEDSELVEFLSMLDLYQEIPADLYKAVAEILAFVYMLKEKKKGGGTATGY